MYTCTCTYIYIYIYVYIYIHIYIWGWIGTIVWGVRTSQLGASPWWLRPWLELRSLSWQPAQSWCGAQNLYRVSVIWPWVKTYDAIFGWMNIHLPSILMFTRCQGFDPLPDTTTRKFATWTAADLAADLEWQRRSTDSHLVTTDALCSWCIGEDG